MHQSLVQDGLRQTPKWRLFTHFDTERKAGSPLRGSVALGTSFSAEVPLPFTYVRVEMNRIWQKGLTQGDPLLPDWAPRFSG